MSKVHVDDSDHDHEDEEDYEYDYDSDAMTMEPNEPTPPPVGVRGLLNQTRNILLKDVVDLSSETVEEDSMKSFEIHIETLPASMQILVEESEPNRLRMTFFLEDLMNFAVRGPKRLKPLLEQTISSKLREHKDAIIDMLALEDFVETCIVQDFQHLYMRCPVCQTPHEMHSNSLIPCNKDVCLTQFTEQGLGRDIAIEIRSDPEVVELLVTMAYWATLNSNGGLTQVYGQSVVADGSSVPIPPPVQMTVKEDHIREANFVSFPERFLCKTERQYDSIRQSLDMLPNVQVMKEMIDSHTFHAYFKDDVYLQEAHYLLTWILNSHRASLTYIPPSVQTPFEAGLTKGALHLFRITNPPEKEAAFQRAIIAEDNGGKVEWVYHGSRSGCWHSILRNSLRVLSNTKQMTTGAAYGPGIYLGTTVLTAKSYCRMAQTTWQQSTLGIQWCILVGEKVTWRVKPNKAPDMMRVEPNEDNFVSRYLLCGNNQNWNL